MNKSQQQVRDFRKQVLNASPETSPAIRQPFLCASLILEEAVETIVALLGRKDAHLLLEQHLASTGFGSEKFWTMESPNLLEAIDGLCDTIYVCNFAAEHLGVDLEPFQDEIQAANMRKIGGKINEFGKLTKPPGWYGPNNKAIFDKLYGGK